MQSKVIKSGKIVFLGSLVSRGIGIVTSIIIANILIPEDYGIMVVVFVIKGFLEQIGSMGYEVYYLLYKGDEVNKEKILNQTYFLRLFTNSFLFVIQIIIGIILLFVKESTITGLILIMISFSTLFEGFIMPTITVLKSKFQFNKITISSIIKELISSIGKITAAVLGLGAFSFGVGIVLGSIAKYLYIKTIQDFKPDFTKFKFSESKEIFHFGKHVFFGSLGMYLVQQIDKILLTFFFPKKTVGLYSFSWGNASMPFKYLVAPQGQVINVVISKFSKNDKKLFYKLFTIFKYILSILLPILIFSLLFVDEIIIILYGDKWLSSIPIMKVMLMYFFLLYLVFPFSPLVTFLGNPKLTSIITYIKAISVVFMMLIYYYYFDTKIVTYSLIFALNSLFFNYIKCYLGIKMCGINNAEIIKYFFKDFVILLLFTTAIYFTRKYFDIIIIKFAIGLFLSILFLVINRETYGQLLNHFKVIIKDFFNKIGK